MQLDSSLFETFQQLRSQQQNRKAELMAQYDSKIRQQAGETVAQPAPTPPVVADPTKPATKLTFASLSSKELQQWLDRSLSSGKLSEEQSAAFKVLIYSATGGDSKNGNNLVNFNEKAQQALQSAIKRKDSSSMLYWANTISTMKKFEGETLPPVKG